MNKHTPDEFYDSRSATLLGWFSKFLCVAILMLIFFGGQVKSHEAGLAVPDWPLTYGENPITYPVSKWTGGIFHEHFHRLFAGGVASLSVLLCVFTWLTAAPRWVKWLSLAAVFAVLAQALLGGLTVIYQLPAVISSSHATLAQTYLLMNVVLAYGLSQEYRRRRDAEQAEGAPAGPWFALAVALIVLVYGQLILGAAMRHTESALAIPDFPKTADQWVPTFSDQQLAWVNGWRFDKSIELNRDLPDVNKGQMGVHFAHRVGAVVVTAFILFLAWFVRARKAGAGVVTASNILLGLVLVQFTLGATVIWTTRLPLITSLHVATGAAVLAAATFFALRCYAFAPAEAPGAVRASTSRETPATA